ncbi:MAG: SH3 domain-containing protein [candidate division NC10 bacterium]|nr:SH3 domain-containing protein [candidate division NC10 bacterium]MBI4390658.1 SH3 domain-containing protein [candidate division NC10 bacterium]
MPSPTPWYVTASSLNLRRCPGVTCGRIGVLRQGDVVLRLREDGEWVEVRVVRTGQVGWVASEFLEEQPEAGPERPTASGSSAPGPPVPRPAPPGGPVKEEFLE